MNLTKSLFALALAGVLFAGCKQTAKEPAEEKPNDTAAKTEAPAGKMETASFTIDGMTCEIGCAKTIERKLAGMDGVSNATVDFKNKTATVEFDSAKQTPEKIVEAVEAVADGKTYKVSNLKSSGDHAMVFNKDKDKKKKKTKKGEAKTENKKGCSSESTGKTGCCAGKKPASCHGEKTTL